MNKIKGGVIPTGFIPAVEKGIVETMRHGTVAGYPVEGVRVTLYDGSATTRSTRRRWPSRWRARWPSSRPWSQAKPVLLEPIMTVSVTVPEDCVGDVIGDLNSRRGRPLGMEPKGQATEVQAEVPMAEMLTYAPDLRQITAGQGDYAMELARYDEVPAHLAERVVEKAQADEEAVRA